MAEPQQEIQLWQTVPPVEFIPKISDRPQAQSLLVAARQGAGYAIAGGQLAHALSSRATHVLLDFSQNGCAIRYQIDGTWEQLPPLDRESGDAMLYAIKQLSLMNPADRRGAQTGELGLKVAKDKIKLTTQSQGVPTGERVLCRLDREKIPFEKLGDLGMRDKMIEQFKEDLNSEGSVILVTAPKGEGLTTTWGVSLHAADRLVRDFQLVVHKDRPEPDVININPNFFGGDTELTEHELVYKMFLKEPDVIIFPEPPEQDSLEMSLEHVKKSDKQILLRSVAPSAMEGLVGLLAKYKGCAADLVSKLVAVSGQRLVRRLCDNCKIGFEPSPQLLNQLGIPAGRVAMLYQPFIPPPIEEQVDENGKPAPITPCHVCGGRGYYGRIAIFEMLRPGEQLRAALLRTQDINQLNQIAKTEGFRGLQSEAVLTVARGLTSLDELKRAFAKK
jgi:type II secretory ATPase GspE/PulE/Tfp pilus assembly ATPase PilB-like protein